MTDYRTERTRESLCGSPNNKQLSVQRESLMVRVSCEFVFQYLKEKKH